MKFKKIIASTIIAFLLSTGMAVPKAEAANVGEIVAYSAVAYAYVNGILQEYNRIGQADQLAIDQSKTGVLDDPAANERVKRVYEQLRAKGIKNDYAVYVSPRQTLGAFCDIAHVISIDKGLLDNCGDDGLGFVLSHELTHGENKHSIAGIQKLMGLGLVVNLYLQNNQNLTSQILTGMVTNYINNECFTMEQEWEADNQGYDRAVAAGFNPGGGAAYMCKVRKVHGEIWVEGLTRIVKPNNHPKTTDRINNFSKKITEYSGNKVTVAETKAGAAILVKGKVLMIPQACNGQLQDERAYLIAGKLAKLFHDKPYTLTAATVGDDGSVTFGGTSVITPGEGEEPSEVLVERLNTILGLQ